MKYLNRIAIFFGLIMLLAVIAGVPAKAADGVNVKATGKQITIEKNEKAAARSHYSDLWIHNTWLTYLVDEDGDGFYHHFRFRFDADTSYASQALVARVYLSDASDQWLIFESNTFWIHGQSGSDVYEISTALNEGYPAQRYDLTLRLYDATSGELLEEWSYLDDSNLAHLFLEDMTRDTYYSSTPYIHSFTTELSDDFDGDGYFSKATLTVDVDAPNNSSRVLIGVEIYDPYTGWESLYLSPAVLIEGAFDDDKETITIELDSGYPAHDYRLRMTIYESTSGATLATESIDQTFPLESLDEEQDDHRSSSSSGHGGALLWGLIPLMLLLLRFKPATQID